MSISTIAFVVFLVSLRNVSSLKCYSCFSYVSHEDCENRYNLKEVECEDKYDTCVKFNLSVTIAETDGDKSFVNTKPAFARYCGIKAECENNKAVICGRMFRRHDANIEACAIDCCKADLKAECHKRPGWPGTKFSSASFTDNSTVNNDLYGKGQRGVGARLTTSIWSLLVLVSLVRVMA